jgi:transposase
MRLNEKLRMIKEGVIIVGIDIAKRMHWAQPMLHNGILLGKPFNIQNNRNGFKSLLAKLELIKQQNNCHEIIIGLEPTGHYWKALSWFLISNQIKVVLVNPFHVKTSKELDDNTQTKSDPKDAMTIGKLVKEGRFFELYLPVGPWCELRVLSKTRNQLKAKSNAVLNHLRAILDEYFPEYETVFKTITGKASLYILTNCLLPNDLKLLGVPGIIAEFRKAVKKGVGRKKAELLYQAACNSVGFPANEAVKLKLSLFVQELNFLADQIATVEAEMEKQIKATGISQYILSIKGIGIVTAAGFLGEIGDPSRFSNWKQVRKLAGFNLVEISSGEHKGQRTISKRGRCLLRNYLYQAALVMVAQNQEFKQLYQYLISRRQNPLKRKQAIVVVAIKLIRVILALIQKKESYDPGKVLGVYRETQLKKAA